MGLDMMGLPIGMSSILSSGRLLGSAASAEVFLPNVLPKKPLLLGRVAAAAAAAAGSRSAGKKAEALVACLGREEHLSGVGGGEEVGTGGRLTFSFVRVSTDPAQ